MDRKGILCLVVVVALFGAWNFYYIRRSQEAAQARQQAEAVAAAEEAAKPKVAPADPTGPANPTAPIATPPVLEAVSSEKIERLSTSAADYAFTNLGGGIRRATLLEHFAEKENRVVLNQFGTIPIGDVSEVAGEGTGKPFNATVDAAGGTVVFDRIDDRQIQITKKFTLPKFAELKGADRLFRRDLPPKLRLASGRSTPRSTRGSARSRESTA